MSTFNAKMREPKSWSKKLSVFGFLRAWWETVTTWLYEPTQLLGREGCMYACLQRCRSKKSFSLTSRDEAELAARVHESPWAPGLVKACPGVLSAASLLRDVRVQLAAVAMSESAWTSADQALRHIQVVELQVYACFARSYALPDAAHGPPWASQRGRAAALAASGFRRASGSSKRGLDHLLPAGLEPLDHLRRAVLMEHPFHIPPSGDIDTLFAAKASAAWGGVLRLTAAACLTSW